MTGGNKVVVLKTNQGTIEIRLRDDIAPRACENFLGLVKRGYYDGIIFHRVIKGFMIQGGDPTGTGTGGESIWGRPFEDEVNPGIGFNKPGLAAMANSGPNTNGSQFFITTAQTPWLNMKHTIFGEVVSGYDVVQKIENAAVDAANKPFSEQKIIKACLR
ncbi:MAG: peptidylprolyl isomerase [Candidatus Omnitrophota bacterium]